ncbi:hypothetical protein L218DRAFT_907671 [Marasmius fiardii PR-910]|nr:hypothetical protein L218DRAFT_907671 [Marasmius fiardii PR-910]
MITVNNNFSAWVTICGQSCQEYDVQVFQESSTATCWIASEAGKEYEVNWKGCTLPGPVSGRLRIDGHDCGGHLKTYATTQTIQGITTGPTTLERFSFSSIKTTDDDSFINYHDSPERGEIKLIIRTTRVHTIKSGVGHNSAPAETTFHETSTKNIDHQTSFRPTVTDAGEERMIKAADYGNPLAIFSFKYRPLAILQANGIAPLPPPERTSPSPLLTHSSSQRYRRTMPSAPAPSQAANSQRAHGSKRPRDSGDSNEDIKPSSSSSKVPQKIKPKVQESSKEDEDEATIRDLQNQIEGIRARKKAKDQASPRKKKTKKEPRVVGD